MPVYLGCTTFIIIYPYFQIQSPFFLATHIHDFQSGKYWSTRHPVGGGRTAMEQWRCGADSNVFFRIWRHQEWVGFWTTNWGGKYTPDVCKYAHNIHQYTSSTEQLAACGVFEVLFHILSSPIFSNKYHWRASIHDPNMFSRIWDSRLLVWTWSIFPWSLSTWRLVQTVYASYAQLDALFNKGIVVQWWNAHGKPKWRFIILHICCWAAYPPSFGSMVKSMLFNGKIIYTM